MNPSRTRTIFCLAVTVLALAGCSRKSQLPVPRKTEVYRFSSEFCLSFANLPRGWKPSRQVMTGLNTFIEGAPDGYFVQAGLSSHAPFEPRRADPSEYARVPAFDVGGYTAWRGVRGPGYDGNDGFLYTEGSDLNSKLAFSCKSPSQTGGGMFELEACSAGRPTASGKYDMVVFFPRWGVGKARKLIDGGYTALETLPHRCEK